MDAVTGVGFTVPLQAILSATPVSAARLAGAGATEAWSAETARTDAFAPLLTLAATTELRLGTAIASIYSRGPGLLAMQAASLAEAAPGRCAVGLGTSSRAMTEGWNDRQFDRPLARMQDVVRFLRAALSGEKVDGAFETFDTRGFRLERPPSVPPPILVAGLGERMLQVAGREADGVVVNWLSPGDVAQTVGAAISMRTTGDPFEVVARIFMCRTDDVETARRGARDLIARYLSVPGYAAQQRWLGRGAALEPMWEAWSTKRRAEAVDLIPDEVVDELITVGSASDCAAALRRYEQAGVTSLVIKMLPLAGDVDEVTAIVDVLDAYRSAR